MPGHSEILLPKGRQPSIPLWKDPHYQGADEAERS